MAQGKKSFLLYADQIEIFETLPDDVAGRLIKHIFQYVNDTDPKSKDVLINVAFASIKTQLKRDLKKYESIQERNKTNGKLGGRPPKPKKPSGLIGNPREPKQADNVNVNDNENKKKNVKKNIEVRKEAFRQSIKDYRLKNKDRYPKQLYIDFEGYWSEESPAKSKMRFELERAFGLPQRLATWFKRDLNGTYASTVKKLNTFE